MGNWIRILIEYRNGKFGRYFHGLTPRLLVGACQNPIGAVFENKIIAYDTTRQMFEEMKNYNEDGIIVSSNQCEIHNGPVMQLTEAAWTVDSIDTSFDIVWGRYGDEIIRGDYGINRYDRSVLDEIFK